ncbi:hypothetical protein BJY59DRAFT_703778 [Rhodotorula toruloides]
MPEIWSSGHALSLMSCTAAQEGRSERLALLLALLLLASFPQFTISCLATRPRDAPLLHRDGTAPRFRPCCETDGERADLATLIERPRACQQSWRYRT